MKFTKYHLYSGNFEIGAQIVSSDKSRSAVLYVNKLTNPKKSDEYLKIIGLDANNIMYAGLPIKEQYNDFNSIFLSYLKCAERVKIMEKYAWKAIVKDGCLEEYCKRHNEIWPELVEVLKQAGICNYTIWNVGNELFGYYECEKGVDFSSKVQAQSPVVDKWNEFMKDVMIMEMDPVTGAQPKLVKVFELD